MILCGNNKLSGTRRLFAVMTGERETERSGKKSAVEKTSDDINQASSISSTGPSSDEVNGSA